MAERIKWGNKKIINELFKGPACRQAGINI